jgi:KaiC/GvpD/RAD55 family RecA-like ATPase
MIRSGIVPIDELYGGFRPRSNYLLTGGAGAGKTTYSLQFANHGLRCGERVAVLTHASREDLLSLADHLGLALRTALREERALVLRYRADFVRRLARSGCADRMIDDLRTLLTEHRPRRVVVDTFSPLLEDGTASPLAALSLVELLESSRATALLTTSVDLGASYDRRLEPLVQSAAGVFRLVREEHGDSRVEVVSLRQPDALPSPSVTPAALPNVAVANETVEIS